jgi:diaminohydroxyphosphoribosylaminopyrimidine deaminase/5-amino-6-(5-phosphoribosylamino)uracil reductase
LFLRSKGRKVDLRQLLKKLASQGLSHILIEGGGEIIASALQKRLVDKMIIFIAPKIIGGRDAPTAVEGEGVKRIREAMRLTDVTLRRLDSELIIEGKPK